VTTAARGPLIAVTGATGFLGRRLIPALAAAGGRVRVLVRRPPDSLWDGFAPEVVVGDLNDPAALDRLVIGAEVVIHGAGLIKAPDRAAFFAANAQGATRLAAAVDASAPSATSAVRMILVSSLAARSPELSHYAASKRAGEDAARAVLGDRVMVVRPPAIYGPGDRETLALFRLAAASPFMPMPDDPEARVPLAHVDDVVARLVTALGPGWNPGIFALGGARPGGYGWREIFLSAAQAMDRTPTLAPVPAWLIHAAAGLSEAAGQLRGAPAIFNRGKARELLHRDWSVTPDEQPPGPTEAWIDLPSGFSQTVAWYRSAGWLI
jgi:nucleoside-diphosphate-sugar epimerase